MKKNSINQLFGCKNKATITEKKNTVKSVADRISALENLINEQKNLDNRQIEIINSSLIRIGKRLIVLENLINEPKGLNNFFYLLLKSHWFLIGIIIILLGANIFFSINQVIEPNNIALILGFVGILATFIVIGNYAHIKDIEGKFMSEMIRLNADFDKKIKYLDVSNDKKISSARFNIEIRAVSSANLYSPNMDAVVEHLSYAIFDANEVGSDLVIDELIVTIRNALRSNKKPFQKAKLGLIKYCLENLDCQILANKKIRDFKNQIENIYNDRKKCRDIIYTLSHIDINAVSWKKIVEDEYEFMEKIKGFEFSEMIELKKILYKENFSQLEDIDRIRSLFKN
ncbi:MAG: hypothetical protein LBG96_16600 [Tannerella sp.]|jgi:hypothetical protein|nr:hypothetical protein [Tannerella sp.]